MIFGRKEKLFLLLNGLKKAEGDWLKKETKMSI